MKYIIVQPMSHDRPDDNFRAIVFEEKLIHREIARCHRAGSLAVISAGFCLPDGSVYGRSDSLNMDSRVVSKFYYGSSRI